MDAISYSFRASILSREVTWTLSGDALTSSSAAHVLYSKIASIRLHGVPGAGAERCLIKPVHGRAIVLVGRHFLGFGRFEDRSDSFDPFIAALVLRVAAANPGALLVRGMPRVLWCFWGGILLLCVCVSAVGVLIAVAELAANGPTLDLLLIALLVFSMGGWAFSIIGLLRRQKSRPLVVD